MLFFGIILFNILFFYAFVIIAFKILTRNDLTTSCTTRIARDGNNCTREFGCDVKVFHAVVSCKDK